jgi:phage baseplate assembly protein gpV
MSTNRITINGKTITIQGNASNVTIVNGTVTVNGKTIASDLSGIVEVKWEGPAASVQSDAAVTCGDVQGNVRAAGSVNAANVGGDVRAGGSVNCDKVGGGVQAGGSVNCRK